jgi:transposase
MPDGIGWVGLDVHGRESAVAVLDRAVGEVMTKRVVGRPHELLPYLREIPRPARMVYEAGPTGYGLARRARAEGIEVAVCAPGKTERPAADRVKTDKSAWTAAHLRSDEMLGLTRRARSPCREWRQLSP